MAHDKCSPPNVFPFISRNYKFLEKKRFSELLLRHPVWYEFNCLLFISLLKVGAGIVPLYHHFPFLVIHPILLIKNCIETFSGF